jgi:hypothetical protein
MHDVTFPVEKISGVPVVITPEEIDITTPTGSGPPCSGRPHKDAKPTWST